MDGIYQKNMMDIELFGMGKISGQEIITFLKLLNGSKIGYQLV